MATPWINVIRGTDLRRIPYWQFETYLQFGYSLAHPATYEPAVEVPDLSLTTLGGLIFTPGTFAIQRAYLSDGIVAMGRNDGRIGAGLFVAYDGNGAPIWIVGEEGGVGLNDNEQLFYSFSQEPNQFFDIWGYSRSNGVAHLSWNGPPGNMLPFTDACHAIYQSSRLPSAGTWAVPFGSPTQVTAIVENFPLPTRLTAALQVTALGGSLTVEAASSFSGTPALPGTTYSVVAGAGAVTTQRSLTPGIQAFDNTGAFISTVTGTPYTEGTAGSYAAGASGGLLTPAGTAFIAPIFTWPTTVGGESHKLCGVALYKGVVSVFAPPFVNQPWNVWGSAKAGDRWSNANTPSVANTREYVCTIGGIPSAQTWVGIS